MRTIFATKSIEIKFANDNDFQRCNITKKGGKALA